MISRVVVLAIGSRGDVEPIIALTEELCTAMPDRRVAVCALESFRPLFENDRIEFLGVSAAFPQPMLGSSLLSTLAWLSIRSNLIAAEAVKKWVESIAEPLAEVLVESLRFGDLVVSGALTLDAAYALGRARRIPVVPVLFAPCVPTRNGASLVVACLSNKTSVANLLIGWACWLMTVRWSRPCGMRVRQLLGLPRESLLRVSRELLEFRVLLPVSHTLVPFCPDWPSGMEKTGPWYRTQSADWCAPKELVSFLDSDPKPLYIGFGGSGIAARDLPLIEEAAGRSRWRIVACIEDWSSSLQCLRLRENLLIIREAPHEWIFSRVAGVVHHGSSGTALDALRAGIPSIAIPHRFDQFFYARRLSGLSVGPRSTRRSRLSIKALVVALDGLANGTHYASRARDVAAALAGTNGVSTAVEMIKNLCRECDGAMRRRL